MYENKEELEKVILFAVDLDNGENVEANLDELEELVATAGAETLGRMIQNKDSIEKATYLGSGKVEELRDMVDRLGATGVVCDDELSPIQMKNLEQELDTKVMDRTMVILDIFAKHATTREGKLQVELAQLKYRSNRLIGMGQVLSRLGGGIGTRGPGEKKLEVDRRIIRERIAKLSSDLKDDIAHREVMRKQRLNSHIPIVSIVGYTNAGKSTLLNHMTQAGVLEEDKLFATLDPTSRNYKLPNGQEIILTDTVGFIRKLPHHLIDAFRSTLEEAKFADIILHVVDISNPQADLHILTVYDTLRELGVKDKPVVTLFNKIDKMDELPAVKDFQADHTLYISARQETGFEKITDVLAEIINQSRIYIEQTIPYAKAGVIQQIRKSGNLLEEEYREDGIFVRAYVDAARKGYYNMELPITFEQNMRTLLKDDYDSYAACLEQPMHHGIRINTMKISVEEFLKINPFHLRPVPWCENGFYYDETLDKPSKHPYYFAGLYYIQEPSAMTPAHVLPVETGDRVLDICAAPGGKSTELAAKLHGTGLLVSNDISASRAKALLKNLEVFGAENALIISEAPYKLAERFHEYFDKILIDAPCSGEGMFRKSASMITAWENNGNQLFADLQRSILDQVVTMLKPGGMLLYSTCTFAPLENEQSIEYLLSLDDRLELVDFHPYEGFDHGHPEWGNTGNETLKRCARLWPHKIEGEGHFVCLVKKQGERDNRANYGDYPVKRAKLPDSVTEFLSHTTHEFHPERFEISGDKLYYIPESFPTVRGLRILRCGLYVGEIKKNRFEPSQSLAMALTREEFDNCLDLPADDAKVIKYLKGETIDFDNASVKNGYVLVCVDGYPLGFGKANQGVLKNKYLPGWRLMS